jgi:FKBP12-rapamycin complex-associated protein
MSGKILHIDFGDCFEVAMTREKFPEKIPFRLTRMLINAMEVTGIEGTYRSTCESVMTVLRHNKDSLMAVLEAFVYDPLLNWRLIETGTKGKKSKAVAASGSTGGVGASGGSAGSSNPTDAPGKSLGQSSSVGGEDDLNPLSNDVAVVPMDDDTVVVGSGGPQQQQPEALNKKALDIVQRVRDKLTGRDFDPSECLEVSDQVDLLIRQATNNENLCQCYIGWCPFW